MIDGIVAALGGVKGAIDLVRGISATIDAAQIAEIKLGLLDRLGEAQVSLADAREQEQLARERIRALEAENAQLREWDANVEDYELADTGLGALAYIPKGADRSPQSGHWHCPNCFANRKKSMMIPESPGPYGFLKCHPCKLEILVFGYKPLPRVR